MIIIYTHGKVASQTIEQNLFESNVSDLVNRTHFLSLERLSVNIEEWKKLKPKFDIAAESTREQTVETLLLRNEIGVRAKKGERILLISGVRDLVTHAFSAVFQSYATSNPAWEEDFLSDPIVTLKTLREEILAYALSDSFMKWFDDELKAFAGFDVRELGFDPAKGWKTAVHGKFGLLIFKQEQFTAGVFPAIADWTGYSLKEPISYNVGTDKETGALYQLAQETIRFTGRQLDEIYASGSSMLFYTDDERALGRRRWKGRGAFPSDSDLIERYQFLRGSLLAVASENTVATVEVAQLLEAPVELAPVSWEQRMAWREVIFNAFRRRRKDIRDRTIAITSPDVARWAAWASRIGPKHIDVVGIDSGEAIRVVADAYKLPVTYREGDPDTRFLRSLSRRYQAICSIGTSDELFNPLEVLNTFRRDLLEEGVLILEMRAIDDRRRRPKTIPTASDSYSRPPPTLGAVHSALKAAGFQIIKTRSSAYSAQDPTGHTVVRALITARRLP